MPRFSIPESDQREFGAPAVLEWNVLDITVDDLEFLSERFGFDPSDWPIPLNGELTLEQAGDPDARPKPPPWRPKALIWTTLRQNGIDVSWEQAGKGHFYLWRPVTEVEDPSPGKDFTEETPSPASGASTTPRSRTSSVSRRRKST